MAELDISWFVEGLEQPSMHRRKGELADAMGVRKGAISEILAGKRTIKLNEAIAASRFMNVDLPFDLPPARTVDIVGYVGAGAVAHRFEDGQGPFGTADAPDGSTDFTVAVEVRGESLGALFDRWLVFYDEVRTPPTASMLGRLCVVGLADGRVLVKQLKRGQLGHPHYNLLSNVEPPIYDVIVEWAAVVKQMTPR